MIIVRRVLYGILFFILFLICLRNSHPVYFDIYIAQFNTPLIVILFISFVIGAIVGTVATLPKLYRQNKQIKDLKEMVANAALSAKLAQENNSAVNNINPMDIEARL